MKFAVRYRHTILCFLLQFNIYVARQLFTFAVLGMYEKKLLISKGH